MTTSDAPGATIRSPKTARARASRSGQGETGPTGRIGAKRATGRRCRVTSMTWPRSTRVITPLRFRWSSRIEIVSVFMHDILYDICGIVKSAMAHRHSTESPGSRSRRLSHPDLGGDTARGMDQPDRLAGIRTAAGSSPARPARDAGQARVAWTRAVLRWRRAS